MCDRGGAAALTGLIDIARLRWWPEILTRIGLDEGCLPTVVRAGTSLGAIPPAAAERFGLPQGCRFVVGCLDQYAGAIGAGNVVQGLVSETTGTVLATVSFARERGSDLGPSIFQGPSFCPGGYYRMTFGDLSANYLEWYRGLLPDRPDFQSLTAAAREVPPGADGVRIDSSRPPARPEDVFRGSTGQPTRGQAVRAILEAVAVALRDQVQAIACGTAATEIRSAGGAARSELWLEIKADVLGVPVRPMQCPEPTSLGAAILAEAALSGGNVAEIASQWVRLGARHLPTPGASDRYRAIYG